MELFINNDQNKDSIDKLSFNTIDTFDSITRHYVIDTIDSIDTCATLVNTLCHCLAYYFAWGFNFIRRKFYALLFKN